MRIVVCGDRNWDNKQAIHDRLEPLARFDPVIITGGYRGADKLAEEVAFELGLRVWTFHANWRRGKRAGPDRNRAMLEVGYPDMVIAFHNDLNKSKGTKRMLELAKFEIGVPVELWGEQGKLDIRDYTRRKK